MDTASTSKPNSQFQILTVQLTSLTAYGDCNFSEVKSNTEASPDQKVSRETSGVGKVTRVASLVCQNTIKTEVMHFTLCHEVNQTSLMALVKPTTLCQVAPDIVPCDCVMIRGEASYRSVFFSPTILSYQKSAI